MTWRSYVSKGYAPPADKPDLEAPPPRRRPQWLEATVEAYLAGRPGKGHRSDLDEARAQRRRQDEAALAEPAPPSEAELQAWLAAHHPALLTVADVLVDHRDDLLDRIDDSHRADLAEAIDQAGEWMTGRPSRALASGVAYAMFQLRPGGAVTLPEPVREVLTRHAGLRAGFDRFRRGAGIGGGDSQP